MLFATRSIISLHHFRGDLLLLVFFSVEPEMHKSDGSTGSNRQLLLVGSQCKVAKNFVPCHIITQKKMKLIIVALFVLVSSVLSAPQHSGGSQENQFGSQVQAGSNNGVEIVRYFYEHRGLDGYKFTLVSPSIARIIAHFMEITNDVNECVKKCCATTRLPKRRRKKSSFGVMNKIFCWWSTIEWLKTVYACAIN